MLIQFSNHIVIILFYKLYAARLRACGRLLPRLDLARDSDPAEVGEIDISATQLRVILARDCVAGHRSGGSRP